jgi:hypothetical protein
LHQMPINHGIIKLMRQGSVRYYFISIIIISISIIIIIANDLLHPLSALYCLDINQVNLSNFAASIGLNQINVDSSRRGQICGHVFRNGEPTYSCR